MREQRADGHLVRRNRDIDAARLNEVNVGRPVNQGHRFVGTKALGEHGAKNVGFFRVRYCAEDIDIVDIFLEQ